MDSLLTNIKQYYEEVKNSYAITEEEFILICKTPFKFVKEKMSLGVLKDIRLKYFGVFKVSAGRIKYSKKALKLNLKRGVITEEHFNKRMKILNSYDS